MFHVANILTPIDLASPNEPALTQAFHLARQFQAALHLVHVRSPHKTNGHRSTPEQIRRIVMDRATSLDLPVDVSELGLRSAVVDARSVACGLIDYATETGIDLLVLGPSPERGPTPAFTSPTVAKVVQQAPCPVFTVGSSAPGPDVSLRHVLAPIDFSRHADTVLAHAKTLTALYGGTLDVLHVIERPQYIALSPTDMLALSDATLPERKALRRSETLFAEAAGDDIPARFHVAHGDAAEQIRLFTQEHETDLIVMSSHGMIGQRHHPLGTVAEKTMRHVACSVFVTKAFGRSLLPTASTRNGSHDAPPHESL